MDGAGRCRSIPHQALVWPRGTLRSSCGKQLRPWAAAGNGAVVRMVYQDGMLPARPQGLGALSSDTEANRPIPIFRLVACEYNPGGNGNADGGFTANVQT